MEKEICLDNLKLERVKEKIYDYFPVKEIQSMSIDQIVSPSLTNNLFQSPFEVNAPDLIQFLTLSGFKPSEKQSVEQGSELFYLHLKTVQGQDHHITVSSQGFFLNPSKIPNFNFHPTPKQIFTSLLALIESVSDKFTMVVNQNLNNKLYNDDYLTLIDNYVFKSNYYDYCGKLADFNLMEWLNSPEQEVGWNCRKRKRRYDIKENKEIHEQWTIMVDKISDKMMKGWKTNTQKSFDLMLREVQMFYLEFFESAIEGGRNVVDGKIPGLSHSYDKKKQIFIANKIFFSLATQNPYNFTLQKIEDSIPTISSSNIDFRNMGELIHNDLGELRFMHTCLINYKGFRLVAQIIIPGLLSSDFTAMTQYGTIDETKKVICRPEFHKLMVEVAKKLNLDHEIKLSDGEQESIIAVSPQIKGIKSICGDNYICDVEKLAPRDLNYEEFDNQCCALRKEAIDSYIEENKIDRAKMQPINVNIGTKIKLEDSEKVKQQEQFLRKVAAHIKNLLIPRLIACLKSKQSSLYLTDSKNLSKALHRFGINVRYLGQIYSHSDLTALPEIRRFIQRTIIIKSFKNLFRKAVKVCSQLQMGVLTVHLLNSLLVKSKDLEVEDEIGVEVGKKKKKRKKEEDKGEHPNLNFIKNERCTYLKMNSNDIWGQIISIASSRYKHVLPSSLEEMNERGLFSLPYEKTNTLRDICLTLGIILEKQAYQIQSVEPRETTPLLLDYKPQPPIFSHKNLIYFYPTYKKLKLKYKQLNSLLQNAKNLQQRCQFSESLTQYNKVILHVEQCYGFKQELVTVFSEMARIHFSLGDNTKALWFEFLAYRCCCFIYREDSVEMIQRYSRLGLYTMRLSEYDLSIYFHSKMLYLLLISYGPGNPDVIIAIANLALIYQSKKNISKASQCYFKLIKFLKNVYGTKNHINISFCYSSLASIHYQFGQIKKSVQFQTQSVTILEKIMLPEETQLNDAVKILKVYREILFSRNGNRDRKMR